MRLGLLGRGVMLGGRLLCVRRRGREGRGKVFVGENGATFVAEWERFSRCDSLEGNGMVVIYERDCHC